jgi:cytochrome P450
MPEVIPKYSDIIIRPIVNKVIDSFIDKGEADFVREFANQIPLRVVSQIIGFPEEDFEFFHEKSEWLIAYLDSTNTEGVLEGARKALNELSERLIPLIEENRLEPKDNVIGHLIRAHEGNSKYTLSNQEIMNMLTLLIPAAADTSSRLIANCLLCLCENPDQLEAVSNDKNLIQGAIEETLRFEPPIHSTIRVASQKIILEDVEIPAGSIIQIMFAAANRDENYFENPDAFNIFRSSTNHFSFGGGRHQCMGQGLARVEMKEVFSNVFDRIKNIRFLEGSENFIIGKSFRSPTKLMLKFDAK